MLIISLICPPAPPRPGLLLLLLILLLRSLEMPEEDVAHR